MEQILSDFKARMKISHAAEDETLTEILKTSYADIRGLVGNFDINTFRQGKELVFERSRYVYNDALEFFYDNFQQRIIDISLTVSAGDANGD
jgi:hypothetical protein